MAALRHAAAEPKPAPLRPARELDVRAPAARVGGELVVLAGGEIGCPADVVLRRRRGREAAEQLEQLVGVRVAVQVGP
jgi:hypothetical protein